ncbi:hypothetical protein POM88_053084 [Heracleum sosnowskyi]|uniref:Uncharacterized protein n=1 Tax=Heracleum sosnowskyi TaxID=360622 RepID=A0AAD8LY31_9APIA|nr:hypothetical protein POM88_053084 [Heracleum sosnowskyi]
MKADKVGIKWLLSVDRKLLASNNAWVTPNVVVAQDGSGRYKNISVAFAAYLKGNKGRYTYDEYITVTKDQFQGSVIGGGVVSLFSIEAAKHGTVAVITKAPHESNTNYTYRCASVVLCPLDSLEVTSKIQS